MDGSPLPERTLSSEQLQVSGFSILSDFEIRISDPLKTLGIKAIQTVSKQKTRPQNAMTINPKTSSAPGIRLASPTRISIRRSTHLHPYQASSRITPLRPLTG